MMLNGWVLCLSISIIECLIAFKVLKFTARCLSFLHKILSMLLPEEGFI